MKLIMKYRNILTALQLSACCFIFINPPIKNMQIMAGGLIAILLVQLILVVLCRHEK